jgi:hypothetical protein
MTELNQGNFINSYWGSVLTPYARAICAGYQRVYPSYIVIPTQLTNVVREEKVFVTEPYQNDVLIIAAHTAIGNADNGDFGQQAFLSVEDLRSGITWSPPAPIDSAPATAYGGVQLRAMPVQLLPEAFFLPKGVRLKHTWRVFNSLVTGGSLTWLALQLVDGQAPEWITMPDGSQTKLNTRMPWFSTIGLGTEINVLGSPFYVLGAGNLYSQYMPAMDCDVEIHSIHANWFTQLGRSTSPENVMVGIADKGEGRFWMPGRAPAISVYGDMAEVYPSLPFTKPYILKAGDRLQLSHLNTNAGAINNAFATVKGVRLCQF